ncbi:MAG: hypothetical protein KM310_10345 [Clostridiales bacterium]|nr:hypothetical protein [Clostridiales bacterium]
MDGLPPRGGQGRRALADGSGGSPRLNFAGVPRGGWIFSLADDTFACASNSHGEVVLATSLSLRFLRASKVGEDLRGRCGSFRSPSGRGFRPWGGGEERKRVATLQGVGMRGEKPLL